MRCWPCGGLYKGPRAWGPEVAGRGDKTGRQMGLKANVGRRQQRESAPGTQRKGRYPQQELGRDGWFVEQLVLELSSWLCVQEGCGLAGKPRTNSTKVTNAECQLKTLGRLSVHSAAPFSPNTEWLGLQKTSIAYLEAMSTVWWCQFHLQAKKVLNTPRDHLKKEPREKTLKYPPIYYQIHTPIDLGMATREAQGGSGETVGEKEESVSQREGADGALRARHHQACQQHLSCTARCPHSEHRQHHEVRQSQVWNTWQKQPLPPSLPQRITRLVRYL